MANTVWSASLKDDVSATAAKMAIGLGDLDKKATSLFASSDGNFKKFEKSLRDSGVAAVDATLIAKKYQTELTAARKAALGLGDAEVKRAKEAAKAEAAMAAATAKAEKERQKAIEKTRQEQEKAMKASLGYQMKSAFKEAINPRQMAIGFARGAGEGILGAPGAMLGGALNLATRVTDMVTNVGGSFASAVLDAAQFRQNAITGLEYMLGTREEAEGIFREAQELATQTPLDTDKVISGVKQLVTAGFSGKESMVLFRAVADQAAKFADDEGMQDKVIAAMSRVKGRGAATGEDLESFRVAGFRAEGIIDALLENPNLAPAFKGIKKGASREDQIKEVKAVLGKGQIGTYSFLNAAVRSLEKGRGSIGTFAGEMGEKSLTGSISNVKSAFGDLLKSTNLDQWGGVKAFQKFLGVVTKALKPENAEKFLKTIQNLTDSLFGGLGNITDSDIQGFMQTLMLMAEKLIGFLKEAWGWFDKLIHAEPGAFLDAVGDVLVDVGKLIGKGILEGVGSAVNPFDTSDSKKFIGKHGVSKDIMADLAERHGEKDLAKFAARFDVQRKAFAEAGGLTAMEAGLGRALDPDELADAIARFAATRGQGLSADVMSLDIPKMAAGGIVTGPTLAIVGEAGPEAIVPLSGTQGRDYSMGLSGQGMGRGDIAVYVNVSGGADPEMTGQVIGREVRRELTRLFERTALEG
ncbi:MAG: hypothetical protein E6Q97_05590 [Desulfurellales bacterium]|nr:MAG: hypothetical protein E6Q97_05590 [Desulfurellales bacterium]